MQPCNHAGYVGGNARFCAQHRSDAMQIVRQALTPEGPTPLALPDLTSARTSTLARPGFISKAVVPPELSLGPRVAGDSDALRFLNPGPDMASSSPPPGAAATTTTPGSASSSVSTINSACTPDSGATASFEGQTVQTVQTVQTLSVEAEPTPPTVPDPAELKRGTCEVRVQNWCVAFFSSWVLRCFDDPSPLDLDEAKLPSARWEEGVLPFLKCPTSPCREAQPLRLTCR